MVAKKLSPGESHTFLPRELCAGQKEEDAELSGSVAHLEQENEEVAKENEELRKKL